MKRIVLMIVPALICGMVFTSCGSDKAMLADDEIDGTYSGTFTVKYFVEMPASWGKGSGTTTLELKDGKYTCTGNPNRIPAGGSGNYSIKGNKIIFEEIHFWTADFDGNLILQGEYDFTFNGKRLKISANKNGVGNYEYDLKKE